MESKSYNQLISDSYIDVVKDKLHELGDDLLCEDIDLLCKYIIIRFLKTSPKVLVVTKDDVADKLEEFLNEIWPFVITFISVVNSSPICEDSPQA